MQTSFFLNDLALIVVVIVSILAAIFFPDFGSYFQTLPVYCVMINFFLSYLSIDLESAWKALRLHSVQILAFTAVKLAVLPLIIYFLFSLIAPAYALAALLLTGVSTGVIAPMVSNMVRGNSSLVLVVVVATSALAPFTLPAIIKIAAARETAISLTAMIRMLAMVLFIPIIVVEIMRVLMPKLIAPIMKIQFPLSLLMFALINLGVFYRYASFFRQEPILIIRALLVVFVLAAIYGVVGIFFFRKSSVENQLAGAVMLGNVNNVLVIVFSSEFFGPVEPMVAAMYMIPFFVNVIPLRYYRQRKIKAASSKVL